MIRRLPSAYRTDTDSNNYKLIQIQAADLDKLSEIIGAVENAHCGESAIGKSLDYLGNLFEIKRDGLSDDDYRSLLLTSSIYRQANGTIDDIKKVVSQVTGISVSDVELVESTTEPAFSIIISATPQTIHSLTSFNKLVNQTRSAGVKYLQDSLLIILTPALWESHVTRKGACWTIGILILLKYSEFVYGLSYFGDATFGDPCERHSTSAGTLTTL